MGRNHPDPPGSTGSTRIHLVDPRIHLPNLTNIDVSAFWATLNYIILKVQMHPPPPGMALEFYGGPGGAPSLKSVTPEILESKS